MTFKTLSHKQFLKDVFLCSLASYGGPEAHYGVFAHQLIQKRSYITEEELSELIGLFSIVPGPSSTQTITAIGYHLGGKKLALLTFLIWIGPAVLTMSTLGLFFHFFKGNQLWQNLVTYLPAAAIAFISFCLYVSLWLFCYWWGTSHHSAYDSRLSKESTPTNTV